MTLKERGKKAKLKEEKQRNSFGRYMFALFDAVFALIDMSTQTTVITLVSFDVHCYCTRTPIYVI